MFSSQICIVIALLLFLQGFNCAEIIAKASGSNTLTFCSPQQSVLSKENSIWPFRCLHYSVLKSCTEILNGAQQTKWGNLKDAEPWLVELVSACSTSLSEAVPCAWMAPLCQPHIAYICLPRTLQAFIDIYNYPRCLKKPSACSHSTAAQQGWSKKSGSNWSSWMQLGKITNE